MDTAFTDRQKAALNEVLHATERFGSKRRRKKSQDVKYSVHETASGARNVDEPVRRPRFPLAVQTNSKGNPFFLATLVRNRPAGSPVTHPVFPPGPAAGLQGTRPLLSSAFSVFLRVRSHRSTYSSFLRSSTECTRVFSCPSSSLMHSRKVYDVHCTLQCNIVCPFLPAPTQSI